MKQFILFMSLFFVCHGSLGNADEPITLYGINLETPVTEGIQHLIDMGLMCDYEGVSSAEELSKKQRKYITCFGSIVGSGTTFIPPVPVVSFRLTGRKSKPVFGKIIYHCAALDFCVIGPGTNHIAAKLIHDGVVPHLTPWLYEVKRVMGVTGVNSGDTYTMFGKEFQSKNYITNFVLETVINYCYWDFNRKETLCLFTNPEFEPTLKAPYHHDPSINWYQGTWGPAIVMERSSFMGSFYTRDWNPNKWNPERPITKGFEGYGPIRLPQ